MAKFDDLEFATVPVVSPKVRGGPGVTVSVRSGDKIKVSFNAVAYAMLGKPAALKVEAAMAHNGNFLFLKLTPAEEGDGWAMRELIWPSKPDRAPSGSITISKHPFEIGLTHKACDVEIKWGGVSVGAANNSPTLLVALPDWAAMLAAIDAEADD